MVSSSLANVTRASVALAVVAIVSSACSTAPVRAPDTAADIATLSSLTDEDHMMISAGRPPISGKAANDVANGRTFEQFKIDETWTPVETLIDRNLAYQRGTFTVLATPKAGGAARSTQGKFVRIYQRQADGSWRMTRDVLLSDPAK